MSEQTSRPNSDPGDRGYARLYETALNRFTELAQTTELKIPIDDNSIIKLRNPLTKKDQNGHSANYVVVNELGVGFTDPNSSPSITRPEVVTIRAELYGDNMRRFNFDGDNPISTGIVLPNMYRLVMSQGWAYAVQESTFQSQDKAQIMTGSQILGHHLIPHSDLETLLAILGQLQRP